MAPHTLPGQKVGYIESWLYRRAWRAQLKQAVATHRKTKKSNAAAKSAVVEEEATVATIEPATPKEAAEMLSDLAIHFQEDLSTALGSLTGLHRQRLTGLSEDLDVSLEEMARSLRNFSTSGGSTADIAAQAKVIDKHLYTLQTNIPIWHFARGLQLFVRDCQRLAKEAA